MTDIPITLTEAAREKIKVAMAQEEGTIGVSLCIAKGKGCGGSEYKMGYLKEADPAAYDKVDLEGGIALYVPVTDSFMMFGMNIDYVRDELSNETFVFENPNEASRCGCGKSFSMEPIEPEEEGAPTSCG